MIVTIMGRPSFFTRLGGLIMIGTQAYLVLSGNYAWLNMLTIVAAISAVPDSFIRTVLPE